MHVLLRLPLMLLDLLLRGAAATLRDFFRGRADAEPPFSPEAEAEAAAAAEARRDAERVAAEEARARRPAARPGAARRRTRPVAPAPEPEPPAEPHVSSEPETVASFGPSDEPGATLEVEAPWPNYDKHTAAEVVRRVRAGDEATRAVVLLYERTHKGRKSVLDAASS